MYKQRIRRNDVWRIGYLARLHQIEADTKHDQKENILHIEVTGTKQQYDDFVTFLQEEIDDLPHQNMRFRHVNLIEKKPSRFKEAFFLCWACLLPFGWMLYFFSETHAGPGIRILVMATYLAWLIANYKLKHMGDK